MNKKKQPGKKVIQPKAEAYKASENVTADTIHPTNNKDTVPRKLSKQAKKTLPESEWLYRSLIESSSDAIFCVDKNGEYKFTNHLFASTFGKSPDYFLGKTFWDIYPKEHADYRFATTKRVIKTGKSESIEVEVPLPDRTLFFYATANPIKDDTGKVSLVMTHAIDITERKRAEKILHESEEKYRILFEMSPDGIVVHDAQGRNIDANAKACDMLGYSRDELLAMRVSDMIPREGPHREQPRLAEVMAGRTVCYERKLRRKDGTLLDVEIRASRVTENKVQAFWRDITERKRAEETLRESEERHRVLIQTAMDGFWMIDLQGCLIEVNEAYCQMSGYSKQELLAMHVSDLEVIEDADDTAAHIRKVMEQGSDRFETSHRRKDGSFYHVEISVQYRNYKEGSRMVAFLRDITEHKQKEETLLAAHNRFEAILKALDDAIFLVDPTTRLISECNNGTTKTFGYTPEEMIGKTTDFLHVDMSHFEQFGREALAACKDPGYYSTEFEMRRKDGGIFPTENFVRPVRNSEGGILYVVSIVRDISERKKTENTLRENRQRFQALVETTSDFIWEMDLNGAYTYCSPQIEKLWGLKPQEMLGKTPFELLLPEEKGPISELFTTLLQSASSFTNMEIQSFDSSGQVRFLEISGVPFTDGEGRLKGYRGITRDITERRRAVEALKQSRDLITNLARLVPGVIYQYQLYPDGRSAFPYSSPGMNDIYEVTPEEVREDATAVFGRLHPDDYDRVAETIQESARTLQIFYCEFRVILPRQGLRWRWSQAHPERMVDGGTLWHGIILDITERKQAEAALRDSEERYRLVVENAMEAIFIIGDGIFKFANSGAVKFIGFSREELISRPFLEIIHPDDRQMVAERYLQRLKGMDMSNRNTFRVIANAGDIKWVEVTATVINWEDKPASLYFLTDITDRKRVEEERQRVAKLESVGLLAGGIAHDFNNILTSILGNISLAKMDAAPGSDLQNSLEQAEKASQRATALTKQLLTFSKGGAPVLKLASLTELLRDIVSFALSGSNVKCHFSIPASLWHAEIDAGQVSQVIHNLVLNAQQSMPNGGTIEVTAENIALSKTQSLGRGLPLEERDYVRIAVADHGTGIPKDHLEKIFDPFFTTKNKGSGLGLATSFSIAHQHGGYISVESEIGFGSTFYLYLPASRETAESQQDSKEAMKPVGKARLLVMDDEKGVRDIAGRMLRQLGYKDIEFAKDGVEAIKLYEAAMESGIPFSAAIFDLTVPGGMGGEVAIQKLLKIDPGIKVIVSSGYIDDPIMAKFRDYGFSGVVAKPYTIEELHKAVQDVTG